MKYYYSVCAIARDEHLYLEDFVNSNRATGAEHFFIYDNNSAIPVAETLKKYVDAGIVDVISFGGPSAQMKSYYHCLCNFGDTSKWIGFFDCDEIMIPQEKDDVQEILKDYSEFGGLSVSWRIFGNSGNITKPNSDMMETYTSAMRKDHYESTHTKAIVQPEKTLCAGSNPHCFVFKQGFYSVSEDFKVVPNAWTPHSSDKLRLNHYFLKSKEEFEIKIKRPRADASHLVGRKIEDFDYFNNLCTEKDTSAFRFVGKAKSLSIK